MFVPASSSKCPKIQKIQKICTFTATPPARFLHVQRPLLGIDRPYGAPNDQYMKERALYLLLDAGWEIAAALGVSRSIGRWELCFTWLKSIKGRPKLLTGVMIDDIQQILREDPTLLLDEIGEWLALYHDQPISTTALHINLQDLALTHKRIKWVAAERDVHTSDLLKLRRQVPWGF